MKKIILPSEIFGKKVDGAIERALSNPEPKNSLNPVIGSGVASDFSYLEGDFGKSVLEEDSTLVDQDYSGASALKVLKFKEGVVKGSNSSAFVLLNKILQKHGRWVARPGDLEKCLKERVLNLKGTGLPIFDGKGTRTLYTENGGLRRLYRYRYLGLCAWDWYLADSYENGWVNFVRSASP